MTRHSIGQAPVTTRPPPPEEEHASIWPYVWILFVFKFVTVGATWWYASRSSEATSILAVTHWFWLFIPLVAIAGPLLFQVRLRKVRRRRAALQASEWMVDELRGNR